MKTPRTASPAGHALSQFGEAMGEKGSIGVAREAIRRRRPDFLDHYVMARPRSFWATAPQPARTGWPTPWARSCWLRQRGAAPRRSCPGRTAGDAFRIGMSEPDRVPTSPRCAPAPTCRAAFASTAPIWTSARTHVAHYCIALVRTRASTATSQGAEPGHPGRPRDIQGVPCGPSSPGRPPRLETGDVRRAPLSRELPHGSEGDGWLQVTAACLRAFPVPNSSCRTSSPARAGAGASLRPASAPAILVPPGRTPVDLRRCRSRWPA